MYIFLNYLSIYLILGLKGVIGTIVSLLLYLLMPYDKFFDIFDKNFNFEYEFLKQPFPIYSKILYIISLVILEYFKVYTINQFTNIIFILPSANSFNSLNHFVALLKVSLLVTSKITTAPCAPL